MIKAAIEYICGLNKTGERPGADDADPVLVSESMQLESLEKYNFTRYRERMTMKTSDVKSYCGYVVDHSKSYDERAIVSVDEIDCTSHAIFNHEQEGHCDDTASCQLVPLPVYAEIQSLPKRLDQSDAIDWVADWNHWIIEPTKLSAAFSRMNAKAFKELEQSETEFQRERSTLERVSIEAKGGEIPKELQIKFTPYQGFSERVLTVAITATCQHGEIMVRLRPLGLEAMAQEIATEFTEIIEKEIGYQPFLGSIKPAP